MQRSHWKQTIGGAFCDDIAVSFHLQAGLFLWFVCSTHGVDALCAQQYTSGRIAGFPNAKSTAWSWTFEPPVSQLTEEPLAKSSSDRLQVPLLPKALTNLRHLICIITCYSLGVLMHARSARVRLGKDKVRLFPWKWILFVWPNAPQTG